MDLAAFLQETGQFRVASREDSEAILDFFDHQPMQGRGLRLRYERRPDFFRFLEFQSPLFRVAVGQEPHSQKVDLVCNMSFRDGYLFGRRTRVGYLGDLRVNSSPRMTLAWRRTYGSLLREKDSISEFTGCEALLTAILESNLQAVQSLVRPRKDLGYRYTRLCGYRMVNVLARLPTIAPSRPRAPIEWRPATPSELDALIDFLDRTGRTRPFGFVGGDELRRRLATWPDFSIESFWLARAHDDGPILGAFAPWSPSPHKRIIVDRYPAGTGSVMRVLRLLGLPVPRAGQELKVTYLTWLELDPSLDLATRQALFRRGLETFWKSPQRDRASIVAFCDFDDEPLMPGLGGFLSDQTPLALYAVESSNAPSMFGQGPLPRPPGFEMALV